RGFALVWTKRRMWPPLSLPWLEIRRDRPMRRSSVGGGRKGLPQERQVEILPLYREGRIYLGLQGPPGHAAAPAGPGMDQCRAAAALRLQAVAGVQLPSGDGRRHRFQPRVMATRVRAQQGSAVQGFEGECLQ